MRDVRGERAASGFGGLVLKLKVLTVYVGLWRCGFEVENLDVLCWELAVWYPSHAMLTHMCACTCVNAEHSVNAEQHVCTHMYERRTQEWNSASVTKVPNAARINAVPDSV